MINLKINRHIFTARSTSGQLFLNGAFECFTLEPVWIPQPTDVKPRAIPEGQYPVSIRWSPKFQKLVPHVENVPGFSEIEIHIGNYPEDTEGCTIVGQTEATDFVGRSAIAWNFLMTKLFTGAVLTNPDSPEQNQIWNVGNITFTNLTLGEPSQ